MAKGLVDLFGGVPLSFIMDLNKAIRNIRDISEESYDLGPHPKYYEMVRGVAQAHKRITELAKSLTVILDSILSDKKP